MTGASHSSAAFLHQEREGGRGERLGIGGDAEERALIDGGAPVERAETVAFRHDHLAVLHDGEADAGHFERLHGARDDRVEIGRRLRDGARRDKEECGDQKASGRLHLSRT